MYRQIKCLCPALILMTFTCQIYAIETIDGIWRHANKPALLIFDMNLGIATVKRHQDNPDAIGLTVIQKLRINKKVPKVWYGEMFHGELGAFVPVTLILLNSKALSVKDKSGKEVLRLTRDKA